MLTLIFIIVAIGALTGLAYLRVNLASWTAALFIILLLTSPAGFRGLTSILMLIGWGVWIYIAVCNVDSLRLTVFSGPILKVFRSLLPQVSSTEQEALDAGTVWWDGELFSGRPDWDRIRRFPPPALSSEEQAFLEGPVQQLCEMLDDWQIMHDLRRLPEPAFKFIREQGFLGMIIPKEYGGLGFSAYAHSEVVMRISSRSSTAGVTVMVPNSLGPGELLIHYGTDEQKRHYLPRLASGEELPCFALTGPWAGSDASAMTDVGCVTRGEYQGEEVLGIRVSWEKRYITLAPVATLLGLAFKLYDPEHLLGEEAELGITLALVPTDHPGVEIGRRHFPAGLAFMNGPTSGCDVFIPMQFVIGGQERIGQGWRMLMGCLAEGRAISLPAQSVAALKHAARTTGAYARVRKQFRVPIGRFEGVEEPLARIVGDTYLVDSARRITAAAIDAGEKPAVISAMLKYQSTARMRAALTDAIDIHGGRALCTGPGNYLWAAYQAAPVAVTVEGANILTRSLIVFGQGAIRCHPYILGEMQAANEPPSAAVLARFDKLLCDHVGHLGEIKSRAFLGSLSFGLLDNRPAEAGKLSRYYGELSRVSAAFAFLADAALVVLGGSLKRREKVSGRFADVFSELYLLTCALKRFEDDGAPESDLPILRWLMQRGLFALEEQMEAITHNMPVPMLGWCLRRAVFPLGRWRTPPSDELGHLVAGLALEPGPARDRLTAGIFLDSDPRGVTGCLEHALKFAPAADALEKRLAKAQRDGSLDASLHGERLLDAAAEQGVLEAAEVTTMREYLVTLRQVVDVDDFDPDALSPKQA